MNTEHNKEIVRRFVEEVQSRHKIELIDQLLSPDYIDHYDGTQPPYLESAKRFFAMIFAAFPDVTATIQEQTAHDDKVWTRKIFQGTHLGVFMGLPPTGKKICIEVFDIFRLEEEKIVEHWGVANMLGLLQQIGAFPKPHS